VHPNGKVAYLGTLQAGIVYVVDVSNPAAPTIADSVVLNARVVNDVMTSEDGKVLVMTREGADNRKNGIAIYTLDDPLHPKPASEFVDPVTSGVHSAYVNTQAKYGTLRVHHGRRAGVVCTSSTSRTLRIPSRRRRGRCRAPTPVGISTTSTSATGCSMRVISTTAS
jgi:hypothetical protein